MPDILIREVPASLHVRLLAEAKKHRQTMEQEVLTILEKEMGTEPETETDTKAATNAHDWPPPFKGKRLLTQDLLTKGIREGRP